MCGQERTAVRRSEILTAQWPPRLEIAPFAAHSPPGGFVARGHEPERVKCVWVGGVAKRNGGEL